MHCATSRKVTGSIPDRVIGIFRLHNPSGRTMTLGLTQSLTEMSTRNISWWVKVAGAWGWQPYHLHVPIVLKSGSLKFLEPSGPVQGCNGTALPYTHTHTHTRHTHTHTPHTHTHTHHTTHTTHTPHTQTKHTQHTTPTHTPHTHTHKLHTHTYTTHTPHTHTHIWHERVETCSSIDYTNRLLWFTLLWYFALIDYNKQ